MVMMVYLFVVCVLIWFEALRRSRQVRTCCGDSPDSAANFAVVVTSCPRLMVTPCHCESLCVARMMRRTHNATISGTSAHSQ